MAETRKEYELLFKLKAALGSNFSSTFKTAVKTTKELQGTISDVKRVQSDISGFQKQQKAVEATKSKMELLTAEHDKLQKEMQETEQPSEALSKKFERNKTQIAAATTKIEEQQRELDKLGDKLKNAGVDTGNLTGENERLKKSYEEVKKKQEEIAKLTAEQQRTAEAISNTKAQLGKTVVATAAIGAAVYAGPIKSAMDFESAIAGVNKTVNGTPKQLLEIQNGIRKMATEIPSSVSEISAIAEAAGQLGIKTGSILGFTRTMADLGVTTNLAGDEAASTLAKFANITGMSQNNFDRLGSTIVALGNNLATTESDIAAMALRLAGAGNQVGLTEAQILSFSGALSSVGIEAEAGGSAFSKVMNDMQLAVETGNKNLVNFSKVAGMTTAEFQNAFRKDAAGAISAFIQGLGKSQEKGLSAIKVLDDMGITEVRMRDALLRAAGASGVFTQSLALGTKAWEENNALTEEARKRYATTESSIKIMKQSLNEAGISIGTVFLPQLANASRNVSELVTRFSEFAAANPALVKTITGVVGAIIAFKLAFLATKLVILDVKSVITDVKLFAKLTPDIIKSTKALIANKVALIANKTQMIARGVAMAAVRTGQLIAAGATAAMTAAQWALNAAFVASPIGWVVLGIGALIAAGVLLYKNWDTVKEKALMLWDGIKSVFGSIGEFFFGVWAAVQQTFAIYIENIQTIFVSYFTGMVEAVKGVFGIFVSTITTVFSNVKMIFTNVIEFVKNVFTVNWQGAWENVKNIFKDIFDTFAAIAKAPINAVIALINGAIKGINKLNIKIPDWVPLLGGKNFGINIPPIPMLAKGSANSPSTFIAGEKGPELITNAPGRTVYTAKQTQTILKIVQQARAFDFGSMFGGGMVPAMAGAGGLTYSGGYNTPATVGAVTNTGGTTIKIENNPVIQISGNAPDDLDQKLQQNNENLLNLFEARIRKKQDDERRQRYE